MLRLKLQILNYNNHLKVYRMYYISAKTHVISKIYIHIFITLILYNFIIIYFYLFISLNK